MIALNKKSMAASRIFVRIYTSKVWLILRSLALDAPLFQRPITSPFSPQQLGV
jgi:hypothetical protein